ncbi:hypothetical protein V5O48_005143 [Marasmius crinis-equi]|uniref:FAD dependent oxidoreductase domain-containing protein n=1 Tax=Marasmius crinis-equi TaxID=585013 RepID=A0ABR3FN48_9AGAR
MSIDQIKHVVVLGAGVVGLTTAISIQERGGYAVSIVAETLPTDPKSIRYASHWAGAQHVTHTPPSNPQRQKIDRDTFKVFWELSEQGSAAEHCFMRITQEEHFSEKPEAVPMSWYSDFKEIPKEKLIPGSVYGAQFTTVTVDPPRYLPYLLGRFLAAGGSITRGTVQHINEVLEGGAGVFTDNRKPTRVDAVVVCTGIGARNLGGIEDKEVYPIRGQTVIVRAPWVKFGRSVIPASDFDLSKLVEIPYLVPRRSGDHVVGGTFGTDDWYPTARPETHEDILHGALASLPELAPPEVRAERKPTVDDLRPLIVEAGCGLRPARKGGIRLESLPFQLPGRDRKVPVITNYGHGGSGFQTSWGSASVALGLLDEALSKTGTGMGDQTSEVLERVPTSHYRSRFLSTEALERKPNPIRSLFPLEQTPGLLSLLAGKPNPTTFPIASLSLSIRDPRSEINNIQDSKNESDKVADLVNIRLSKDELEEALQYAEEGGVQIQTDEDGVSVSHLRLVLESWPEGKPKPKVFYTVPTGSNPSGATATAERRAEVLRLAREHDFLILEDDPYYYLYYGDTPRPPSYFSLEATLAKEEGIEIGRVVRFDSCSKILSAGMRIGWASGPEPIIDAMVRCVGTFPLDFHEQLYNPLVRVQTASINLQTPTLTQMITYALLSSPSWGLEGFLLHASQVAAFYKRKCDIFETYMQRYLGTGSDVQGASLAKWEKPKAGMFYWQALSLCLRFLPN